MRPGLSGLGLPATHRSLPGLQPVRVSPARKTQRQRNPRRCLFSTQLCSNIRLAPQKNKARIAENSQTIGQRIRRERLGEDPRQGSLFVFSNRRHTRIKILCWDGTGLWVLTKRLEKETFSWPRNFDPQITKMSLTPQALAMLTDGVDLRGGKLRPWYERE
jgi:transposase